MPLIVITLSFVQYISIMIKIFHSIFNIILSPTPKSASGLFHSGFYTSTFMVLILMRATCLSHFVLVDYFKLCFVNNKISSFFPVSNYIHSLRFTYSSQKPFLYVLQPVFFPCGDTSAMAPTWETLNYNVMPRVSILVFPSASPEEKYAEDNEIKLSLN
jgi:hypothetical protein